MTTGTSIRAAALAVLAVAAWTVPYSASQSRGERAGGLELQTQTIVATGDFGVARHHARQR